MSDDCLCGVKFGRPLQWLPTPQWCFAGDCCWHDMQYARGGTESDRRWADREFYRMMRYRVRETKAWWQRPGHYALAWVYYRAVRWCGGRYFNYQAEAA